MLESLGNIDSDHPAWVMSALLTAQDSPKISGPRTRILITSGKPAAVSPVDLKLGTLLITAHLDCVGARIAWTARLAWYSRKGRQHHPEIPPVAKVQVLWSCYPSKRGFLREMWKVANLE